MRQGQMVGCICQTCSDSAYKPFCDASSIAVLTICSLPSIKDITSSKDINLLYRSSILLRFFGLIIRSLSCYLQRFTIPFSGFHT